MLIKIPLNLSIFCLFLTISTQASYAQIFDILVQQYKLKGKVKLLVEQTYHVSDSAGTYKKGQVYNGRSVVDKDMAVTFNDKGMLTQRKHFTVFDKSSYETYNYVYNKDKLMEMNRTKMSNKYPDYKEQFQYDKEQRLVRLIGLKKDLYSSQPIDAQPFSRTQNKEFVYDNKGRQIEIRDSLSPSVTKFVYNDKGQKSKQQEFTTAGVLFREENYQYDANGNNTILQRSGLTGAVDEIKRFNYNDRGGYLNQ